MNTCQSLTASDWTIIAEEEEILERVLRAIADAQGAQARKESSVTSSSRDTLRDLRDQAQAAREEDLPSLLHEMSVRQRLLERAAPVLPDPKSPYLAHLRLRENCQAKDYLLGRASLLDPRGGVRLVDWRVAPVAQIFYRYREGDDYEEELPGRIAEGQVEARRILTLSNGRLEGVLTDTLYLQRTGEGHWYRMDRAQLALETGGAGTAARPANILGQGPNGFQNITALLDPLQYAAICAPPDQALLVLGSAGSGKTTVALHRLAYLQAQAPERFPMTDARVVVPEEGLARLTRRLLEPLVGKHAPVETLDQWAFRVVQDLFEGKRIRLSPETPGVVCSLKRHPALYAALRQSLAGLKPAQARFRILRRRLAELYTERGFLEQVVAASNGTLSRAAVEETVRHTMLQIADPLSKELKAIVVPELKEAIDGKALSDGTPLELAGTLDPEDLAILISLRIWKCGVDSPSIGHLVLDEAEDFSLFELFALGSQLREPKSLTMAGDEAQQTSSAFSGWTSALSTLKVHSHSLCRLQISYRCPRPVTQFARAILGTLAEECVAAAAREGAPVGRFRFANQQQSELFVVDAAQDLLRREPQASIAVLFSSEHSAEQFFPLVRDQPAARLVLAGDFGFEPGLDVTHVDAVKGLEFDYVIIPDASASSYPNTEEARRRLHVAATRAAHQLWVVAGGAPSPLIPWAG